MIRINLLAAERPTQKKKAAAAAAPGAIQAYLFLGLFGGGALLVCALGWWLKEAELKELGGNLTAATQRRAQLQTVEQQVQALEARRKTHQDKVNLIRSLKAQQTGPVHLLDEISKSLPDFVWLTELDQRGNTLQFSGESSTLTAVADFISNLQAAGEECGRPNPDDRSRCWFPRVDLSSSNKQQNNLVAFKLTAEFAALQPVAAKKAEAAAPGAGPATAAPPAAGAR